jgi:HEAT repeat protein
MNAFPHSLILRGILAAGFLAAGACAVTMTAGAQEPTPPPTTPEDQQKQFAEIVENLKKTNGAAWSSFQTLATPAARPFAHDVLPFVRDKKDDDGEAGREAALCLGKMGARELADDLVAALPEVKEETRYGIMTALEQFGDKRCIDAAKMLLSSDGVINFDELNSKGGQHWGATPPMQDAAIRLLVRYRTPGLEEEVAKMLTSPKPQARLGAIRCLREMGATSRAGDIAKLIGPDQPPGIRSYAILTLGDFRAAAFLPDIAAVLEQKRDEIEDGWPELEIVLGSFGGIRNPLPMLERPEFPISVAACKVLAAMNARQYIPQMARALETTPWRVHVLRALADLKAREAGPQIAALLGRHVGGMGPIDITPLETLRIIRAVDQAPQVVERLLLPTIKSSPEDRADWDETCAEVIEALEELSPALLRDSIPGVLRTSGLPLTKSRVLAVLGNMDAAPFADDVRKLTLPAESVDVRMEAGRLLWEQKLMPASDALAVVVRCLAAGMASEKLLDKSQHPWPLQINPRLASPLLSHAEDDVVLGALRLLTFANTDAPPEALMGLLTPLRPQKVKEAALDAMTAAVALNDGQLNAVTALAGSEPELAAEACLVLLRHNAVSQTPLLLALLQHGDRRVGTAAGSALLQLGDTLPAQEVYTLIERSLRQPKLHDPALFTALSFLERDAGLRPAIPFLASGDPVLPKDPAKAREALTALSVFCAGADAQKHKQSLQEAAIVMARIVRAAAWDFSDALFLHSAADQLSAKDLPEKNAVSIATIRAVAKEMAAQHPLRRAARVLLWIITVQVALWLVVLALYPWSRPARWIVWNRWTRRWLGFCWV